MTPRSLALGDEERRAWREDGFFLRRAAFAPQEVEELRAAAERVVLRTAAAACESRERYAVDGNVYVEGEGATLQLEHGEGSATLRVVEPFHHLDAPIERLAMPDAPSPHAPVLLDAVVPGVADIVAAMRRIASA